MPGDPIPGASGDQNPGEGVIPSEGSVTPDVPSSVPVENPVEAQNRATVNTFLEKNNQLDGRLLSQFPTEDGGTVLVFRKLITSQKNNNGYDGAGVDSRKGPILVRKDVVQAANQISDEIRAGHPSGSNFKWETLMHSHNGNATPAVEDEVSFRIWSDVVKISADSAKREMATEAAKKQYVPKALEVAQSIQ